MCYHVNEIIVGQNVSKAQNSMIPPSMIHIKENITDPDIIKDQVAEIPGDNIIAEPSAKHTAPCIGLGALYMQKLEPEAVMASLHADHYIADEAGFRQALLAAKGMVESVNRLSESLSEELAEPLRIGIGIHCGPAVVGRMGYGSTIHITAIGDTVNVASRLSGVAEGGACLVGPGTYIYITSRMTPTRQISVRLKGKAQELVVYEFRPDAVSVGETKTVATNID